MHNFSTSIDLTKDACPVGHVVRQDSLITSLESPGMRLRPHASVEDYSRIMLQYTQRQMAASLKGNSDDGLSVRSGTSGRSNDSGQSSVVSFSRSAVQVGNTPASAVDEFGPGGVIKNGETQAENISRQLQ